MVDHVGLNLLHEAVVKAVDPTRVTAKVGRQGLHPPEGARDRVEVNAGVGLRGRGPHALHPGRRRGELDVDLVPPFREGFR